MPSAHVADIQRARLLAAAAGVLDELGYEHATVAHITGRARVSRRTFYELFTNREECLFVVFENVVSLIQQELTAADLDGLSWRERVRGGLSTILTFFDREPALARICVVHVLNGGPAVLRGREQVLAGLAAVVHEGCRESSRTPECTPLIAEGLVGAACAIVYARLLRGERKPLIDLVGELMGMVVLPYRGPAAARREQACTTPSPTHPASSVARAVPLDDVLGGVPMRLTYRTSRVLEAIAAHPGASNREVAGYAEIGDQGQVSKLLARLERLGLLVNTGEGHVKGEPNVWRLTAKGAQVAQGICTHINSQQRAA